VRVIGVKTVAEGTNTHKFHNNVTCAGLKVRELKKIHARKTVGASNDRADDRWWDNTQFALKVPARILSFQLAIFGWPNF